MSKKFWKTFKPLFSDKSISAERLILVENNEILSDESKIAETFNTYFGNITKKLNIETWPEPNELLIIDDDVIKSIIKYQNHPSIIKIRQHHKITNKFEFKHIMPEDVKSKINSLCFSKSTRGDIPIHILKENIDIYCNHLTDIFNSSINNAVFPDSLKLGDITPVFKKNDKLLKANYRPITILSALSKVLERLISDQLNVYMTDNLSNYLCGFRKGFNTEDALLRLLENWRSYIDRGLIVGTVLCDLSKAFDTLPHDLIIAKLAAYGMEPNALKLLADYLKGRKQRVKVGSSFSTWIEILLGVPQGSVLGPILFNIFMNDLLLFIEDSLVCNFADDTSLYAYGDSIETLIPKLERDVNTTILWFANNSLVPNPDKFQLMFLGTRNHVKLCLQNYLFVEGHTTWNHHRLEITV